MAQPFDVCWQRIERATLHREAIAKAWNAFCEDHPYSPLVHVDAEGFGSIQVFQNEPLPGVLALEIGEFLHQLRAALDASVYECACVLSGTRPPPNEESLEFPICPTADAFKQAGWKIRPLAQEQRRIIESVQPYNAVPDLAPYLLRFSFNRALAMLNDWGRKDRHRKLHVVGSWVANVSPVIELPPGVAVVKADLLRDGFFLDEHHGDEVATFQLAGWGNGMKLSANPNLSLDVALNESPEPAHDSDTLHHRLFGMQVAVRSIVDGLATSVGVKPPEIPVRQPDE